MQTSAKRERSREREFFQETHLPLPLSTVFAFFSNAENLQALTPPSLHFKILSPLPIRMASGALIDYRLRLFGIPFRWRTRIDLWQPPHLFVDSQVKGPYLKWVHEHSFHEVEDGVLMTDRVQYLSPGGIFEPLIHRLFVGPQVRRIFEYRTRALERLFALAR